MIHEIGSKALELGFISIGFSRPERPIFFNEFKAWVASGRNAGMSWLERNMDIRENPAKLLSGCRTIISLAYPYPAEKPATEDGYTLARYSVPFQNDYHILLRKKSGELCDHIDMLNLGSSSRTLVDSAPFLERSFAHSSGIGTFGKNNMLIIPDYGSYFFLSEILTTANIDIPAVIPPADVCGSCTKCIDACPTGALGGPHDFDSSKCLSYLTIECSEPVDISLGRKMNKCFLGCDICQEVCPHNIKIADRKCLPSTADIMGMSEEFFIRAYGKTALSRAGLAKIKTNILAAGT